MMRNQGRGHRGSVTGSFMALRRCEDCGSLFDRVFNKSAIGGTKLNAWKCQKCRTKTADKGDPRSIVRLTKSYGMLIGTGSGTGRK